MHWEDLEEYQVGGSGMGYWAEVGVSRGRWDKWEYSCLKLGGFPGWVVVAFAFVKPASM